MTQINNKEMHFVSKKLKNVVFHKLTNQLFLVAHKCKNLTNLLTGMVCVYRCKQKKSSEQYTLSLL